MKSARKIIVESVINNSFSIKRIDHHFNNHETFNRLTYHRIFFVETGVGYLSIDNNTFVLHDNSIFLLSKGQIYGFSDQTFVKGFSISFGDCFWQKTPSSASNCKAVLFNNTSANPYLKPNETEVVELLFLFNALLSEYCGPQYINQMDALAAFLKIIMIKLANIKLTVEATFDSQDYILYRKFMEMLSAQFDEYHAVADYAKMLHISARRLSELCKRCSGIKAKEIINGQLIAEAKRLLQFSVVTVKEIAYALHFNSAEQFSHFFKKNTKMSPLNYRNQFVDAD
jgi:AraC-like DNA-binding protein